MGAGVSRTCYSSCRTHSHVASSPTAFHLTLHLLVVSISLSPLAPTPVCSTSIERTLAGGTTIICDRYAFSGVAFSTSKGLPFEWCRAPDVGLPEPDLTLFLDISPEKAKERGGYGKERYEKEEMQRRVREVFTNIAAEAREQETCTWVSIDAGRTLEAVTNDIWKEVELVLGSSELKPLHKLWHSHTEPS
ncbi:hypothetical protein EW145_g1111 [Phellinidium pouzarii]|uniref:dTMP kinase n=1 Tax=Phellinidium pouzarii TaxID=167371 RepID=A0A4S4LFR2_9AGAM|nr:hypothetical protein EW145_g1111 [Phellinidium pouzarii]